jgi:predicted NACHT family NTPase
MTVGMLKNGDKLLQGMKWEIDLLLVKEKNLQRFLAWGEKKSCATKSHYKSTAIRAYYHAHALGSSHAHVLALALDSALDSALTRADAFIYAYSQSLDSSLALNNLRSPDLVDTPDHAITHAFALGSTLNVESIGLNRSLQQLKDQLPDFSSENHNNWNHWWQLNGRAWSVQLADVVEHCNIGHSWQFSVGQVKLLQQYYEANKLLVDCLSSDCYVSREVREEIESTLLLPFL